MKVIKKQVRSAGLDNAAQMNEVEKKNCMRKEKRNI